MRRPDFTELLKTKEGRAIVRHDAIITHAKIMRDLDEMDFEEDQEKRERTPIVTERTPTN